MGIYMIQLELQPTRGNLCFSSSRDNLNTMGEVQFFRRVHIIALVVGMATASFLVLAANDNCAGSGFCGRVNPNDCRAAIGRYTDGHVYSQYTSRVSGHCTAIYQCSGFYPSIAGSNLKEQFLHVYNNQPCKKCGSHAFFGGSCQATLNYCANCRDSGDPNSSSLYA